MRITILAALFILVSCDGTDQSEYEESIHSLVSSGYVGRGLSKTDSGDHRGAIEDYNKAIQLDPNNAQGYVGRGFSNYHCQVFQLDVL
jgi:Tfp pilus assembly protein PilF